METDGGNREIMEAIYLNNWKESGLDGLREDFGIGGSALDGVDVILASYGYDDYEGCAFVLFRKDGKLFEVNGSHCSCHGLSEGISNGSPSQWEPEETTLDALRHALQHDTYRFDGMRDELRAIIENLLKSNG